MVSPRPWNACVQCAKQHTTLSHVCDACVAAMRYADEGMRMWRVLKTLRAALCTAARSTVRA